jgi:hypothetical protein
VTAIAVAVAAGEIVMTTGALAVGVTTTVGAGAMMIGARRAPVATMTEKTRGTATTGAPLLVAAMTTGVTSPNSLVHASGNSTTKSRSNTIYLSYEIHLVKDVFMTDPTADNGDTASLDKDLWDVIQYKTDKRGRTNWLKLGRAWAAINSDKITVKLFALPTSNQEGDVLITLVPRVPA